MLPFTMNDVTIYNVKPLPLFKVLTLVYPNNCNAKCKQVLFFCKIDFAGLSISKVPFPSVVICSQGSDSRSFLAAELKLLHSELANKTIWDIEKFSPVRVERYLNKVPMMKVNFYIIFSKVNFFIHLERNFF